MDLTLAGYGVGQSLGAAARTAIAKPSAAELGNVDPIVYEHEPGLLGSVFRWFDRPGQVVRNLIRGDTGAAGRHLLDIGGELVDAFVPGDWIPAATRKQDYVYGEDLLGIKDEPWYIRYPLGIGLDILTDPLTYLSKGRSVLPKLGLRGTAAIAAKVGANLSDDALRAAVRAGSLAKAAKEATRLQRLVKAADRAGVKVADDILKMSTYADDLAKAAKAEPILRWGIPFGPKAALPVTRGQVDKLVRPLINTSADLTPKWVKDYGRKFVTQIRSGFGALEPEGFIAAARRGAEGLAQGVNAVEFDQLKRIFQNVTVRGKLDRAASAAMHNFYKADDGVWKILKQPFLGETPGLKARTAEAAKLFGVNQDILLKKTTALTDILGKAAKNRNLYGTKVAIRQDYMPRIVRGLKKSYDPSKMQKLDSEAFVAFLNKGAAEGVDMVDSAYAAVAGRLTKDQHNIFRAQLMDGLFGQGFANAHKGASRVIGSIADDVIRRDPSMGKWLQAAFKKELPDYFMAEVLAANNKIFKPAATMGLFLPRMMFNTRNRLSAIWQRASVEGGKWHKSANPMQILRDLHGSIFDGLKTIGIGAKKGRLYREGKWLSHIDDVFKQAAGDYSEVRRLLRAGATETDEMLLAALEGGVLQGYVASEGIIDAWARAGAGWRKKMTDFMRWPSVVTEGMESRMRLGMFNDLYKMHGAKKAVRMTADAMLDYSMLKGGPGYNVMRQLFPFLAFTAQSIPQQAKFLLREPAVAVALGRIFGNPDEPVMPWIAEQPSLKLGQNPQGESLYLTGFGLPVEALNFIPQFSGSLKEFGTDVRKQMVGASHPLLKFLSGTVFGIDPFFGTTFGSYARTPPALQALGMPEESELSRQYNLWKQTGLLQPVESALNQANTLLDPRLTAGTKALRFMTGARVAASDPDAAIIQILQDQLAKDPTARTYRKYIGGSEESDRAIQALKEARKALKKKRELATQ